MARSEYECTKLLLRKPRKFGTTLNLIIPPRLKKQFVHTVKAHSQLPLSTQSSPLQVVNQLSSRIPTSTYNRYGMYSTTARIKQNTRKYTKKHQFRTQKIIYALIAGLTLVLGRAWILMVLKKQSEKYTRGSSKSKSTHHLGKEQILLLERMAEKLPDHLKYMKQFGVKQGHWAWWAFPTEMRGKSEPPPSTCVTRATAAIVISKAPRVWRDILECICQCAEKNGKNILPKIDHGRVKCFIRFWEQERNNPPWMKQVLRRLTAIYK